MSNPRSRGTHSPTDKVRRQHLDWLGLVEVSGPFLTLPVLRENWPTGLDPLESAQMRELRQAAALWRDATAPGAKDPEAGREAWVEYVLGGLLDWREDLRTDGLEPLAMEVAEHDTAVAPSFVLTDPGTEPGGEISPNGVRLLGLTCPVGHSPVQRVKGESWSATPADRLAQLCRHHGVELGLATDGRWWVLVWAPRGGVTTTALFDASLWTDAAERDVLRAFYSLLNRRRFFSVTDDKQLAPLLKKSMGSQEDVTEALGVQVRQAVELLVAAIGRADTRARERGERDLSAVPAHDVYRGAVSVMMRTVFLLFAEERGLLPSDNDLYAGSYSAGGLYAELEALAREGTEDDLERTTASWHRLLALFHAVYHGVDHPKLKMHALDGSLFNPETFPWLPLDIDDRTVLHMLKAVQYVKVGRGKSAELRKLSFRALDVEQIGYVYEGLLAFDGFRAEDLVVGLVGKEDWRQRCSSGTWSPWPHDTRTWRSWRKSWPPRTRTPGSAQRASWPRRWPRCPRRSGPRPSSGCAAWCPVTTCWWSGCCPSSGSCATTCAACPWWCGRRAVRHRVVAAQEHGDALHAQVPGRGGRGGRAGAAGVRAGAAPDGGHG
ncbi:hypothetical protein HFP72_04860 [Nocardiopsis sp. ARC36]